MSPEATEEKNRAAPAAVILGMIVSGGLLLYLFTGIDWSLFFGELKRVRPGYLVLSAALVPLAFAVRAYRWRFLLGGSKDLRMRDLYDATMLGMLGNMVLPLRVGEAIRALALSQWQPVSFSRGFATVVVERVFDVLALLLFLGLTLGFSSSLPPLVTLGIRAVSVIAVVISIAVVATYLWADRVMQLLRWGTRKFLQGKLGDLGARIEAFAQEFIAGLRGIGSLKQLITIVLLSAVIWAMHAGIYALGLGAFGLEISPWMGMVLNVVIAFAVAAPSAPGFVGTFQAGCLIALESIGHVSHELALAYAVVLHTVQFAIIVVLGVVTLQVRGVRLTSMRKAATAA